MHNKGQDLKSYSYTTETFLLSGPGSRTCPLSCLRLTKDTSDTSALTQTSWWANSSIEPSMSTNVDTMANICERQCLFFLNHEWVGKSFRFLPTLNTSQVSPDNNLLSNTGRVSCNDGYYPGERSCHLGWRLRRGACAWRQGNSSKQKPPPPHTRRNPTHSTSVRRFVRVCKRFGSQQKWQWDKSG